MSHYPIFLKSEFIHCLVVGGGMVATRKVTGLVGSGIQPTIVSPEVTEPLAKQIRTSNLNWLPRTFQPGDTSGFNMVFAATASPEVNLRIKDEALANNLLFDDVSDASQSNFIVPALVKRGSLQLAVTTSGYSPYLCSRLKQFFDQLLPADSEKAMIELKQLRDSVIERAAGDEQLKKHLMETELEPHVLEFLKRLTK